MLQLRLPLAVKYVHSWIQLNCLIKRYKINTKYICIFYILYILYIFVHSVYLFISCISSYHEAFKFLCWEFLSDFWYVADPRKMANFKLDLFFNLVWGGASGETREGQPGVDISDVSRSPVMDNGWFEDVRKSFSFSFCPVICEIVIRFSARSLDDISPCSQCLLQTVPRCLGVFCSIENVRNTRKLIFLCTTCRKY